jgi:uncharacterized protein (DUF1800 family)
MKPIDHTPAAETAEGAWAPYRPDKTTPWDLRRVVHLHRRAGLGASWPELERDLRDGPEASISRLLEGRGRLHVPHEFQRTANALAESAADSGDSVRLKASWIFRMLLGPDPLGERLTLMWHDHFATSNAKVDSLPAMHRQNEIFREHTRAPFGRLLNAAMRDPAMLVWLDAPANRKGRPNENLARELMELFTLGIGHYTERDVKESARALTGWTVRSARFEESPTAHDDGEKIILHQAGRWCAADLLRILLDAPATAARLAWRLCHEFMGEQAVGEKAIAELADGLRAHNLEIGWGVAAILRSKAFFAEENIGARVSSPAEHVVGTVRSLGLLDPLPYTPVLAEWVSRLGQDLFYPPNVGGWPGGRAWLTTRSVIGRARFAAAVADGRDIGLDAAPNLLGPAVREAHGNDVRGLSRSLAELLLGRVPSRAWLDRIVQAIGERATVEPATACRAVGLILASPEAQLT